MTTEWCQVAILLILSSIEVSFRGRLDLGCDCFARRGVQTKKLDAMEKSHTLGRQKLAKRNGKGKMNREPFSIPFKGPSLDSYAILLTVPS